MKGKKGATGKAVPPPPPPGTPLEDSKKKTEAKKVEVLLFQPTSSKVQEAEKASYIDNLDAGLKVHAAGNAKALDLKGSSTKNLPSNPVRSEVQKVGAEDSPVSSPGSSTGSSIPLVDSSSPATHGGERDVSPVQITSPLAPLSVIAVGGSHHQDILEQVEKSTSFCVEQVSSAAEGEKAPRPSSEPTLKIWSKKGKNLNPKHIRFISEGDQIEKDYFPPLVPAADGVPLAPKPNPAQASGLFANNRSFTNGMKINKYQVSNSVTLEDDDLDRLSKYEHSLVGYFTGRFPGS